MNTIQKLALSLSLSLLAVACADGSKPTTSTDPRSVTSTANAKDESPKKPVLLPVAPDELIDLRGSGGAAPSAADYGATEAKYRVFGVEPGDGVLGASAVIADTSTWSTRSYKIGDAIGRGLEVKAIGESGVTLRSAHGDVAMAVGADVTLRVIRHRLDIVAQPLGRHRFGVDPEAARSALDTVPARPTTEANTLYDLPVLKLLTVAPGSVFAAADFREGDLVATLDGKPAGEATLAAIERGLTDGRARLEVRIYRGGVALDRSYDALR